MLRGFTTRVATIGRSADLRRHLKFPVWPAGGGRHIEFTNRTLTFVVGLTLLATLVVAILQRRERRLAALAPRNIPAQAVLGGIVVLTDLTSASSAPTSCSRRPSSPSPCCCGGGSVTTSRHPRRRSWRGSCGHCRPSPRSCSSWGRSSPAPARTRATSPTAMSGATVCRSPARPSCTPTW